jgi:hypothetical protein
LAIMPNRDRQPIAGGQQRGYGSGTPQAARLRADGASPDDAAAAIEKDARARWTTWDYPYWIGLAVRAVYQAGLPEGATT